MCARKEHDGKGQEIDETWRNQEESGNRVPERAHRFHGVTNAVAKTAIHEITRTDTKEAYFRVSSCDFVDRSFFKNFPEKPDYAEWFPKAHRRWAKHLAVLTPVTLPHAQNRFLNRISKLKALFRVLRSR